jgi:hypothetical protein
LINQTDEIDSYVEKKLQKNNIELWKINQI